MRTRTCRSQLASYSQCKWYPTVHYQRCKPKNSKCGDSFRQVAENTQWFFLGCFPRIWSGHYDPQLGGTWCGNPWSTCKPSKCGQETTNPLQNRDIRLAILMLKTVRFGVWSLEARIIHYPSTITFSKILGLDSGKKDLELLFFVGLSTELVTASTNAENEKGTNLL